MGIAITNILPLRTREVMKRQLTHLLGLFTSPFENLNIVLSKMGIYCLLASYRMI